jgi:hypothetical protein
MRFLQRFFRRREPPDRAVIDMSQYAGSLKRLDEDLRAAAASQERVARLVLAWSRDCIHCRGKAPLPTRLPRNCGAVVLSWLDGLYVAEIYQVSKADRFAILHHLYGDPEDRIADVRAVQFLRPTVLVWPTPVQVVEQAQSDRSSGGGPKMRRYR